MNRGGIAIMDAVRVLEKHGIGVSQGPDDWLILRRAPDVLLALPIGRAAVLSRDTLEYICEVIPEIGVEEFYIKPLPLN